MTTIDAMTDQELRCAAHQCEIDLQQAVEVAPQSERHAECFSALHMMCTEMNKRGMTPQSTGVLQ
jgi:hypothetical protein